MRVTNSGWPGLAVHRGFCGSAWPCPPRQLGRRFRLLARTLVDEPPLKLFPYAGVAAASALAAFAGAWLLTREEPAFRPAGLNESAPLEKRFPEQFAAWQRPSREDARWRELRGHAFSLK